MSSAVDQQLSNDNEEMIDDRIVQGQQPTIIDDEPDAGGHHDLKSIHCDGNDSGVEIGTIPSNLSLQRAQSNTSSGGGGGDGIICAGINGDGCANGLNDTGHGTAGTGSCNSSVLSYCSAELYDIKLAGNLRRQNSSTNDCTSEGGSESSSVTGVATTIRRSSTARKKVALTEPPKESNSSGNCGKREENSVAKSRSRAASANRAAVRSVGPNLATRDRARSREKPTSVASAVAIVAQQHQQQQRSPANKRPPKPDSLTSSWIRDSTSHSASPATHKSGLCRAHSVTRGSCGGVASVGSVRTPGSTPTVEDGRWPSVAAKQSSRATSATPDNLPQKSTKAAALTLDLKSSSIDKYATLPRRRKEKSDDNFSTITTTTTTTTNQRSSSVHRDRMTSSLIKRQHQPSKDSTPSKSYPPNTTTTTSSSAAVSHKHKKHTPKTKIYHEISIQTAITLQDVAEAFAGNQLSRDIRIESTEKLDQSTQSDIRDRELERLNEQIRKLSEDCTHLQGSLSERSHQLSTAEQQLTRERDEKEALNVELKSNTERVMAMLELINIEPTSTSSMTTSAKEENCDSLLMLESQIQQSGYALEEKQSEIDKLHSFCSRLQIEMQRSMNVQRNLREEREVFEKESTELQDFLQDEKSALMDALKEAESDMERAHAVLQQKDAEVEQLRNECRHLVRCSEQRRQEFLGMQSKYNALESRSKELIVQQSSAVSGASMALAGLGTRLDNLVDQLITSYNISEQDLEDVIFHNEAYTNSASSEDASPDNDDDHSANFGDKSPQRHQSFVTAVINAIRNAATSAKYSVQQRNGGAGGTMGTSCSGIGGGGGGGDGTIAEESDSTEMLDSETEPCLMMEHVLEDVSMPDSHSHNMVSSSGLQLFSHIEMPPPAIMPTMLSQMDREEESFHNLSQAIANRQRIELHSNRLFRANSEPTSTSDEISMHESIADIPSISDYCSAQAVVDQVIEVDNSVTKLLKVLRIIQMDNDNCIQQLIGEKNKLQLNKEEQLEKLRDWEDHNGKLKRELEDATHQLMVNSSDLASSRIDLQRHRAEIDRLNVDICDLSTLCSQKQIIPTKETILNTLQRWQDEQSIPEPDILAHIVSACHEIPMLREQLFGKSTSDRPMSGNGATKPLLLDNWKETVCETKRQYDAIDRALETLNTIQTVVEQCPALLNLQRDLEETNFQSAGIIPIYSALLSASAGAVAAAAAATTNGCSKTHKSDLNANAAAATTTTTTVTNGTTVTHKNISTKTDSPTKNAVDSTA